MCFLGFANGKTLEKGRVSCEEAGRGLSIKMRQSTNLSPALSPHLPGAHLERSTYFQDTDFQPHMRNKVGQICC